MSVLKLLRQWFSRRKARRAAQEAAARQEAAQRWQNRQQPLAGQHVIPVAHRRKRDELCSPRSHLSTIEQVFDSCQAGLTPTGITGKS